MLPTHVRGSLLYRPVPPLNGQFPEGRGHIPPISGTRGPMGDVAGRSAEWVLAPEKRMMAGGGEARGRQKEQDREGRGRQSKEGRGKEGKNRGKEAGVKGGW